MSKPKVKMSYGVVPKEILEFLRSGSNTIPLLNYRPADHAVVRVQRFGEVLVFRFEFNGNQIWECYFMAVDK